MPTIKKQMRNLSKDMARADEVLDDYKNVSLEDIKREFEGKTRNSRSKEKSKTTDFVNQSKYAQAYMLKKYGENVRRFSDLSADEVAIYGLEENRNPYLKFLDSISNGGKSTPKWLSGEKVSNVLFDLIEDDDPVVDLDRGGFVNFLNEFNSNKNKDDDFLAYYIQAFSWITNPQKMKDFNPDNPELDDNKMSAETRRDQIQAKTDILSGAIDDKGKLTQAINTLATKTADTSRTKKNTRKEEPQNDQQISKTEFLEKFDKLTKTEQKEFKRIANQLGIDLKKLGLEYA